MNALPALFTALGRINSVIGRAGVFLSALLVALMTVIVIAGVVFRYALNDSITWVEDVSLIMMVSVAFLIAPFALRTGANVAIEMFAAALPRAFVRLVRVAILLLVLRVLWRLFAEASGIGLAPGKKGLVARGWGIRVNTVPIPWAWPYMLVPAAFAAMALAAVELLLRDLRGLLRPGAAADLPHIAPIEGE